MSFGAMVVWLIVILFVCFVGTAACILAAFVLFDRLIRIERERHHETWVCDVKPMGFFWIPPDNRWIGGSWTGDFARSQLAMLWLFCTPQWIKDEPDAQKALCRMRWLVFTSWVGSGLILAIVIAGMVFVN